jgi:hypothetical protein
MEYSSGTSSLRKSEGLYGEGEIANEEVARVPAQYNATDGYCCSTACGVVLLDVP